MSTEINRKVMEWMQAIAAKTKDPNCLQLPHPSGQVLGTQYAAMEPGQSLTARFAFNDQFVNPMRTFQGGLLSAAIDEVFGPLSYMAAETPVVTVEMSTTYLRPFTARDEWIEVRAEIVSKTKTLIVMRAEVRNKAGKLVATSTNHSLVVRDENLAKSRV